MKVAKTNDRAEVPIFSAEVDAVVVTPGTQQAVPLRHKAVKWEAPPPPRRNEFLDLWPE